MLPKTSLPYFLQIFSFIRIYASQAPNVFNNHAHANTSFNLATNLPALGKSHEDGLLYIRQNIDE
jgi:hypothetical protein